MTGAPDNFFTPLVLGPGLTLEERVTRISDAINRTTPAMPPDDFDENAGCIGEYNALKRHFSAIFNDVQKKYQAVAMSFVHEHARKLEEKVIKAGFDADRGDDKPFRQMMGDLRNQLAREEMLMQQVLAPNALLTEVYTVLAAVEPKVPYLSLAAQYDTADTLRVLAAQRHKPIRHAQVSRTEKSLDITDFMLRAVASYHQSEAEKQLLRGHLEQVRGVDTPLPAPATARFRRKPPVQP